MSETEKKEPYKPPRAEELLPLEGKELASWTLAPGDIFFKTPGTGRILRLKRAGEFLEPAFIAKMRNVSTLFWFPLVHLKRVNDLIEKWETWKAKDDPADRELFIERFSDEVRAGLHSEGGITVMDWAYTCHLIFKPDQALQENMLNRHVVLHRRGFYISSLTVLFGLACGYTDPLFLKELHQTGWLLDNGLLHDDFSYWTALACQMEKHRPGAGLEFLTAKQVSAAEKELFLQHPRLGYERAVAEFQKKFTFPSLLTSIHHHHELEDGKGFPKGISLSLISDWEALIVLADQLVDYREEVLEGYTVQGLREMWQSFRKLPSRNLPVIRVRRKISEWSMQTNLGLGEVSA